MHYILDAYNIIHKSPALARLLERSLQESRKALVHFCKTLLQLRGDIAKITLVFDGSSDVFSGEAQAGSVEVIYTATGEDADDRILEYLRHLPPRARGTVVSDDNYVCNNSKALFAKVMSVADFLALTSTKSSVKKSTEKNLKMDPSGKKIGFNERNDITQAYAQYLGLVPRQDKL